MTTPLLAATGTTGLAVCGAPDCTAVDTSRGTPGATACGTSCGTVGGETAGEIPEIILGGGTLWVCIGVCEGTCTYWITLPRPRCVMITGMLPAGG